MLRKRWQPRRLRASFPPMPSPATSDRRAYHRLALPRRLPPLSGRCSDDKRPNALSPTAIGVTTSTIAFSRLLERRAQTEGRCAVFAVRFVRGSGGARVFIRPHGRGWKIVGTAPIATIFAEEVASPKSICEWAKSGQGRTSYEQTVLRARKMG